MTECIECGATDDKSGGIVVGLLGELNESYCNVCRADHLAAETTLSRQEAKVIALKQLCGMTHDSIAELLDISKSTVDEYSRRANDKQQRAEATVAELDR